MLTCAIIPQQEFPLLGLERVRICGAISGTYPFTSIFSITPTFSALSRLTLHHNVVIRIALSPSFILAYLPFATFHIIYPPSSSLPRLCCVIRLHHITFASSDRRSILTSMLLSYAALLSFYSSVLPVRDEHLVCPFGDFIFSSFFPSFVPFFFFLDFSV